MPEKISAQRHVGHLGQPSHLHIHAPHGDGCRNPLHCYLPPHVLDQLSQHADPNIRRLATDAISHSGAFRATRDIVSTMPTMAAIPSPTRQKHRLVYAMNNSPNRFRLPGELVRSEGQNPSQDDAVNEAYDFSGYTYDFYQQILGRNSIDGQGMTLISSVHFGRNYNNAFWNGEQMVYGDGDGTIFVRFTRSLDVVGHELTHGVVQHTSNLIYEDEPGALNEHFADVMGALIKQWHNDSPVDQADWYMGGEIMAPSLGVKGLRTFKGEKAYVDHPILGTDPQPKHMRDKYIGEDDNGGVHSNSGIPNYAFYLVATELAGRSWEKAGKIWYQTLLRLNRFSGFQEAAAMTYEVASTLYEATEVNAVRAAWQQVGITV